MNDPFIKQIEFIFRKSLIALFKKLFHRNKPFQATIDFNKCKFLFIRQDRIGDVLVSTPIFHTIKKYYPNAIIDVLLSKNNHFALESDPLIRNKWIYEKKIFSTFLLFRNIRKEKYDYAVDLMDNISATSTLFCLCAGAKWNIGLEKENKFAYDINVPMLSKKDTHIITRIAQLLIPFGIEPRNEKLEVRYFISKESERFVKDFLNQTNPMCQPLIGINISAGSEARFWGIDNFIKVIKHIEKNYPSYKIIILYKPSDEKYAKLLDVSTQVIISSITNKFDQYAAFISKLSFLLTPDTSAVHLASAFKISAVVLYVQSNKNLRIWEPHNTDYEAIITDVDDLSTIKVESVVGALDRLIDRKLLTNYKNV